MPILGAIEVDQGDLAAVQALPLAGVVRTSAHGEALIAHLADLTLPVGEA